MIKTIKTLVYVRQENYNEVLYPGATTRAYSSDKLGYPNVYRTRTEPRMISWGYWLIVTFSIYKLLLYVCVYLFKKISCDCAPIETTFNGYLSYFVTRSEREREVVVYGEHVLINLT